MKKELLRSLPKIDEVLMDEGISALMERIPRETVVDAVRDSVETIRADILAGKITEPSEMKLDTIIDRNKELYVAAVPSWTWMTFSPVPT